MKMRPALFLLTFCLLIPPAAEDKKQNLKIDKHLSKEVGEDVTLDCHHPKGRQDVTKESVYWKFNNDIYVLVFKDRKISYDPQGKQFKGRASEDSSWNPAEGKLSLKISPVKAEDAGNYTCSVKCLTDPCSIGQLNMSCSTRLSITPKSEGQRKVPDGNHGDQGSDNSKMATDIIVGSIVVGVVGVVGVVISIICFIERKKKLSTHEIIQTPGLNGEAGPPQLRAEEEHLQPL